MARRSLNPDRKTWVLSTRASDDLRSKLMAAIDQSGRTLTQEVEMRLERSFSGDDFVGGLQNAAFLNFVGAGIKDIELKNKAYWLSDHDTWQEVADLINRALEERKPLISPDQVDATGKNQTDATFSTKSGASSEKGKPTARKISLYGN